MTKKINFETKYQELVRRVFLFKIHPDLTLMANMGFSPPAWKVWKRMLIERTKIRHECMFSEEEQKDVYFNVEYIKKEKIWIRKDISFETIQKEREDFRKRERVC